MACIGEQCLEQNRREYRGATIARRLASAASAAANVGCTGWLVAVLAAGTSSWRNGAGAVRTCLGCARCVPHTMLTRARARPASACGARLCANVSRHLAAAHRNRVAHSLRNGDAGTRDRRTRAAAYRYHSSKRDAGAAAHRALLPKTARAGMAKSLSGSGSERASI